MTLNNAQQSAVRRSRPACFAHRHSTPARAILPVLIVLFVTAAVRGQDSGRSPEGLESGNYIYQGAFEFGYRFVDTKGSASAYDTFVNQQEGPRLLSQTLSMRSKNHAGGLFDSFYWSSFGWGGEPENASRLRVSKNRLYNLDFTFRRDQNVWDYNLLANPLNPPNTYVQIDSSPHRMDTRRRAYDTNLTLFPQSAVRFRLGYARNVSEGPSYTSLHEGTDTLILQNWRTTSNNYQAGVDFKILPRTNIGYDQFMEYYKGDSSWADNNFAFQLANGTPVDAGLAYNTAAGQPCATPVLDATTTPATLNPACNGYLAYTRTGPVRGSYPTEQLTLQSNYFRRLDISARGSYSSSESQVASLLENFQGLATRSRLRVSDQSGSVRSKRVVGNSDFGLTVHITDRLRLHETFRFSNFRIPGAWDLLTTSLFGATLLSTPNQFAAATCPPPFTAATCPQHNASSGADIVLDHRTTFLGQNSKQNTMEIEYELSRRLSGHLGYRYENRSLTHTNRDTQDLTFYPSLPNRGACAGLPLDNGVCTTSAAVSSSSLLEIHGHSALFGISARPIGALRLTFDTELFWADHTSTRISPRQQQQYRARGAFKPKPWLNLSATTSILESRNNVTDINHREHNRNYGFALQMAPKDRFSLDLGYNYNDVYSTTNMCYVTSPAPAGAASCGTPMIVGISTYDDTVNFTYGSITLRPVKRVTTNFGYNLVSTSGSTLILTPTQGTLGPLAFNYHKPFASIGIDLAKGFAWNTSWGYFGYNEKSAPGLAAARDFHSNQATLSLRYSF